MRSRHPVSALAAPARGLSFAVYSKEQVYLGHLATGGRDVGLRAPGTWAPSDPIPAGGLRPGTGVWAPQQGEGWEGQAEGAAPAKAPRQVSPSTPSRPCPVRSPRLSACNLSPSSGLCGHRGFSCHTRRDAHTHTPQSCFSR